MLPFAISNGEVIIVVVLVVVPIAAIAFAGAGSVYEEIGKGAFAMDRDSNAPTNSSMSAQAMRAEQQEEIRQMLEAKAYRQRARGEEPLDVEEEMKRVAAPAVSIDADPELMDEVRQLVIARNKRRLRQGKEPLDVEEEMARQLRDIEGFGQ